MQTYELTVEGRSVKANSDDTTLVRTSVGIDQIHVLFDSAEWLDFPLTVTFAQKGVRPVTDSIVVSRLHNSDKWVAEATCTVPYEVIQMVGKIRVTFQGTDSNGRHIITALGYPLSVEEAGDVAMGEIPADAPTVDQWQQAYADAMAAANAAQSLVTSLEGQIDQMIADARAEIGTEISGIQVPATTSELGSVIVGNGLSVTEEGVLSTLSTNGITMEQATQIANLARLAYFAFDTTMDDDGVLQQDVMVKSSAIPIDGETITVDEDGRLCMALAFADEGVY